MTARLYGHFVLVSLTLLVAACDQPRDRKAVAPPPRQEFIRFEYQFAPAVSDRVLELNQHLQNGEMVIEEASLGDQALDWCVYEGNFETTPSQVDPDLIPPEQTRPPILNSFGSPYSMGFNFMITAYQSRNKAALCGSVDRTIQGLNLVSSQGSASGTWRPGDQATVIVRPEMGGDYLGKAVTFKNELDGLRLFFDHAVDSVSEHGYIKGRFCFLALSEDGDSVILVRKGEFGMQGQR
jgi:hypothetical protein